MILIYSEVNYEQFVYRTRSCCLLKSHFIHRTLSYQTGLYLSRLGGKPSIYLSLCLVCSHLHWIVTWFMLQLWGERVHNLHPQSPSSFLISQNNNKRNIIFEKRKYILWTLLFWEIKTVYRFTLFLSKMVILF